MVSSSPERSAPPSPGGREPASTTDTVRRAERVRLEMKSGASGGGHVDGAWWPRSRDLRAELPDLLAAFEARVGTGGGPVLRVGFGLREWEPVGRGRLVTATGRVTFGGYATFEPDVLWLSSHSTARRPTVLLVVPPETPEDRATDALHRAATAGNTERPVELLAGQHG